MRMNDRVEITIFGVLAGLSATFFFFLVLAVSFV